MGLNSRLWFVVREEGPLLQGWWTEGRGGDITQQPRPEEGSGPPPQAELLPVPRLASSS